MPPTICCQALHQLGVKCFDLLRTLRVDLGQGVQRGQSVGRR